MNRKLCFVGGRDTWKIISTERSLAGGKQYKTNTPAGQWSVLSVLSVCSQFSVFSVCTRGFQLSGPGAPVRQKRSHPQLLVLLSIILKTVFHSCPPKTKKERSGNMIKLLVVLTLMRGGEMLEGMVCNDKDTILYRLPDEVKCGEDKGKTKRVEVEKKNVKQGEGEFCRHQDNVQI